MTVYNPKGSAMINRCRLYLQAISLYDILTYDLHGIHPSYKQGECPPSRHSTIHWPNNPKPPKIIGSSGTNFFIFICRVISLVIIFHGQQVHHLDMWLILLNILCTINFFNTLKDKCATIIYCIAVGLNQKQYTTMSHISVLSLILTQTFGQLIPITQRKVL
jgi:hypothetical protein